MTHSFFEKNWHVLSHTEIIQPDDIGVFETFLCHLNSPETGIPFFIDHINRLHRGSLFFSLQSIEKEDILNILKDGLTRYNFLLPVKVRVSLIKRGIIISISDWQPRFNLKNGISTIFYRGIRTNPNYKSIDTSVSDQATLFANSNKKDEALLVDSFDNILEGAWSNVFWIHADGNVTTPPTTNILPGITRAHVIKIAEKNKITILEKNANKKQFDKEIIGGFISHSTHGVVPIRSVEQISFSVNHPITTILSAEYRKIINECFTGTFTKLVDT